MNIPSVKLHPGSLKYLNKGHFWVTKDKYSLSFPKSARFLKANNFLFLHDSEHPQIKARKIPTKDLSKNPWNIIEDNISKSIENRKEQSFLNQRDHFYLIFGEEDGVPGVFLRLLNNVLYLESYCYCWEKEVYRLLKSIKNSFQTSFPNKKVEGIFFQQRNQGQKKNFTYCQFKDLKESDSFAKEGYVNEFGIKLKTFYDDHYDIGIYTDMANIREKIFQKIKPAHSFLNLFSYTGIFSLLALEKGFKSVISVDLSKKYMSILEDNIKLNPDLNLNNHESLVLSHKKAFKKFISEGRSFDFILCDPPSFSSDGKKRTAAIDMYKQELSNLEQILSPKGEMVLFLNTHKISLKKFKEVIQSSSLKVIKTYFMKEDCPTSQFFEEGNYLKGLHLIKKGS